MNARRMYLGSCAGLSGLACLMAMSTACLELTINQSRSLPGTLYLIDKHAAIGRGDLVAFRWHGGGPYPAGVTFIKVVHGMPGDVVRREGQGFWVNQTYIGVAKTTGRDGQALQAASPGIIAPGEIFVATASADSLDSRYQLSGNIASADIVGRAYALF